MISRWANRMGLNVASTSFSTFWPGRSEGVGGGSQGGPPMLEMGRIGWIRKVPRYLRYGGGGQSGGRGEVAPARPVTAFPVDFTR